MVKFQLQDLAEKLPIITPSLAACANVFTCLAICFKETDFAVINFFFGYVSPLQICALICFYGMFVSLVTHAIVVKKILKAWEKKGAKKQIWQVKENWKKES